MLRRKYTLLSLPVLEKCPTHLPQMPNAKVEMPNAKFKMPNAFDPNAQRKN
jgi:hypothetical protein